MILNDLFLKATAWTLVHSIWQGLIVALLAGMIVLLTRKSTAALRYNLLAVLFVVFLAVAGCTFVYEFGDGTLHNTGANLNLPIINQSPAQGFIEVRTSGIFEGLANYLNSHSTAIVMIWFVFFSVKFFGISSGFVQLYRIRNYRNFPVSVYWNRRLDELAVSINLKKNVTLLESALIKVPSVSGFFKPIILVPIGLLAHLPHDQAEAILLHELAHIKRKDYLINLLQHVAELIFFFNPGLLWLSSLLREERENCCDDLAVAAMRNKVQLVRALVSFEEYQFDKATLSLGFGQKKQHLLSRAKRILHNDNQSLGRFEKTFLLVGFLTVAITFFACSSQHQTDAEVAKLERERDELVNAQHQMSMKLNADIQRHHEQVINQISKDTFGQAAEIKRQIAQQEADVKSIMAEDKKREAEIIEANNVAILNPVELYQPEQSCTPANKITRITTSKTTTDYTIEKEQTQYDPNKRKYQKTNVRTGVSGNKLPDQINVDYLTTNIISDLMAENVIADTQNLSYMLSRSELIVNGVAQSSQLQAKLQKKYMKPKYNTICYNYEW